MTLSMTKTTSGFIVEGRDAVGKEVEVFYTNDQAAMYLELTEFVAAFETQKAYQEDYAKLPNPERDLYLKHFGTDDKPEDKVLDLTLVKPHEQRVGTRVDFSIDPIATVLRLIETGNGDRLRLIGEDLVDLGPR